MASAERLRFLDQQCEKKKGEIIVGKRPIEKPSMK
jgi:hypothetical protein